MAGSWRSTITPAGEVLGDFLRPTSFDSPVPDFAPWAFVDGHNDAMLELSCDIDEATDVTHAVLPDLPKDGNTTLSDVRAVKRARLDGDTRSRIHDYMADLVVTYMGHTDFAAAIGEEEPANCGLSPSLVAALVPKSTATLVKRYSSLRLYRVWFDTTGLRAATFFTEDSLFRYCKHLHADGAPATRASSCRQAFNFMGGLLGLDTRPVQKSARVHGLCVALLRTRGAVRQRRPLTMQMVMTLEKIIQGDGGAGEPETLTAGIALFALYGRARIGDLARCPYEPALEVGENQHGYVETKFDKHKTARPGSRRALPITAAARGLLDLPWAAIWLEARSIAGQDAAVQGTVIPAAAPSGGWHNVPLLTQEFGAEFRSLLLRNGFSHDDLEDVGCHSLKATTLAWAARFGLPRPTRRLLGYHLEKNDRSLEAYSRDAMAAPLRELDGVLKAIRDKRFNPEESRSGQLIEPAPASESSCASSCSAEESQDDEDIGEPAPVELDCSIVMNKRTCVYHIADNDRLRCGKALPKAFAVCPEVPSGGSLCTRCW